MANENNKCKFCHPINKSWEDEGFYGYHCFECTGGKTAFVILKEHKGVLTEEEKEKFKKVIKKHYPDLEPKGLADKRKVCNHWYEFMIKKK